MVREGSKTDQEIARETMTTLNRAESCIINVLRNTEVEDEPHKISNLIKSIESIHHSRLNIITLMRKMRKRHNKLIKYKRMIKSFNGGYPLVSMPSNLFEIEEIEVMK